MIPLRNGIAVLTMTMVLPTLSSLAQSPGITLEDYTSSITTAQIGDNSINQQIGSPLGMAALLEGDAVMFQGLFAKLVGVSSTLTDIDDVVIGDVAEVSLAYDATMNALTISVPDSYLQSRLMIVNLKGENVLSVVLSENSTTVDLSSYAPGIYMAGVATQNSIIKSLKFNLK